MWGIGLRVWGSRSRGEGLGFRVFRDCIGFMS